MYIPTYFKNTNIDEVRSFIRQNGFAMLVNIVHNRPYATHIPMELSDDGSKLLGHVSRGNEQWKHFTPEQEVLAIFTGPHTYISSSWYNHENVPTWNYIAAHVYGKLRIITGQELFDSLKQLLDKYERHSSKPVSMENMSPEMLNSSLRGLVGFEIAITEVQASYKLSQNRDNESYGNVIKELEKRPDENSQHVAKIMKSRRSLN